MTITDAIRETKEKIEELGENVVDGFRDKKAEHQVEKAMREERHEIKREMKHDMKETNREMKQQERDFKRDMRELDRERRAEEKIDKHLDYANMTDEQKMQAKREHVEDRMNAEQEAERDDMKARHASEHERADARMEDCRGECLDGKHEAEMQAMGDGDPLSVRKDMPIM